MDVGVYVTNSQNLTTNDDGVFVGPRGKLNNPKETKIADETMTNFQVVT
jgi:hypothetical protein